MEFYTEICNASTLEEEEEICLKYNKDFKKVTNCINNAMTQHMSSSSNSKSEFHEMIIAELKTKNL